MRCRLGRSSRSRPGTPTPSFQGTGSERTLTVSGSGAAERDPDTAYVDLQLTTTGADALAASCENDRALGALRARLGPLRLEDVSPFPGTSLSLIRPTAAPLTAGSTQSPALNQAPLPPYGWAARRVLRVTAALGTQLRDAVAAAEAVHANVVSVRFGLADRAAANAAALASAMRDAAARANAAAVAEHVRLGGLVRIEVAAIEPSAAGPAVALATAVGTDAPRPAPVAVNASLDATFPVASGVSATVRPAAALVAVRAYGFAARAPDFANLSVGFSDRDDDRTALLYRHETAYDALWARLSALGIDSRQVPNGAPLVYPNRTPPPAAQGSARPAPIGPVPPAQPTPFLAYTLSRHVNVNRVPISTVAAAIAAFAKAGATTAEVTFFVDDRDGLVAAVNADARRNAAAQAKAVASAAGLRIVEPPHVDSIGPYPATQATVPRASLGPPDHPRRFEPPAQIDAWTRANVVYALAR